MQDWSLKYETAPSHRRRSVRSHAVDIWQRRHSQGRATARCQAQLMGSTAGCIWHPEPCECRSMRLQHRVATGRCLNLSSSQVQPIAIALPLSPNLPPIVQRLSHTCFPPQVVSPKYGDLQTGWRNKESWECNKRVSQLCYYCIFRGFCGSNCKQR